MPAPSLHVALESDLPERLTAGATALFVCGWCYSPESVIRGLRFVLNGDVQPVMAFGMPRLDPFQALHPSLDPFAVDDLERDPESSSDPLLHAYASGFWGIVRVPAAPVGSTLELAVEAELDHGERLTEPVASLAIVAAPSPLTVSWPPDATGPKVAICIAAHNPPPELFERQIASIRDQTYSNWVCLISDDCSDPAGAATLDRVVGDDPRFTVSRSPERLGFYRNFERVMSLVGPEPEFLTLADQDDHWDPDKLEVLVGAIGSAQLVFSDARVVSETGEVLADTWWETRHNNHSDLLSLLVANSVTGAASLLRRDLLEVALPFPPAQFAHFHDHWLGLAALARGDIAYVDRPLYDYVQHGQASLGHAAANQMTSLSDRLRNQRGPAERIRMWRLHYFVDICRLWQFAWVLELRCGATMSRRKHRVLRRFLAADQSGSMLVRLGWRGALELTGRRHDTLGAEWMLFCALVWRRLLASSARPRPQRKLRLDALPPPTLIMPPGKQAPLIESVTAISDKIAPLQWRVSDHAPRRINLLIPTIDLAHFFGGYIAKLNLARRLVEAGHRVRIVTVDPVGPLPPDWRRTLQSYHGLERLFEQAEVVFGRESGSIEISREDGFIASTWWTAHIAGEAMTHVDGDRFVYLIQEYEPFTFAMGSYAALAEDSYRRPHFGLFSSELLREYFRRHRIGVFADDSEAGDRCSASFENAITAVAPPTVQSLNRPGPRRLLFYARPEPHAARNMFELGLLALSRAAATGALAGWELHGIGTVEGQRTIALGRGASLDLLPRSSQGAYGSLLREHDVGLALMYTPHPSLVPIEMASAGILTVTNSFENKTAESMAAIAGNLVTVQPSLDAVAKGLVRAAADATDLERRVAGSAVAWSRDWDQSFDRDLIERVIAVLGAGAAARA